jgi:hypothetical protein
MLSNSRSQRMALSRVLLALLASASLLAACSGGGSSGPPAPTVTLTAAPTTVQSGAKSTLTWTSTNATSCTASQGWTGSVATSGSESTAALTASTSYTLTCTGSGGMAAASATVTVTAPAPTVTLTANATTLASGAALKLTWSSTNATSCTASAGWSGSEATSGSASVTAYSPVSPSLLASANLIGIGNTGTPISVTGGIDANGDAYAESLLGTSLTWSGVTFALGGPDVPDAVGNAKIPLPAGNYSTLLLLAASVNGDSPRQTFVVTYADGTTTTIVQSLSDWFAPQHYTGESIASTMPYRITATGATDNRPFYLYGYSFAIDGTKTVSSITLPNSTNPNNPSVVVLAVALVPAGSVSTGALTATDSYTLTCTGAGGTAAATAVVTVNLPPPPPPPTVSLTPNPASVPVDQSSTLTWSSTNATVCEASGGWSGTEPTSGGASTGAVTASTAYTLTCAGTGGSTSASATVNITATPGVIVTPRYSALTLSQSQQFTASVPGGGAVAWSVDGIAGGSTTIGTISASGLYSPPSTPGTHTVVAASVANPAQAGSASVAITDLAGIYTFHNDLARTGQNLQEYALTPTLVASGNFGLRWSCAVDGDVYAQPLYVANLAIGGGTHNVLFVATQHDSVYAFDADNGSCTPYWQISTLTAGATTIPPADTNTNSGGPCLDIPTEYGITGSPVIDPASETLYFVANSKESGNWFQRLHAISLTTGAEQAHSPVAISASGPGTAFSPLWQNQRPGLALYNGNVVIGWSAHCDNFTWNGWLMSYNEVSLAQTAVFNVTPNGSLGGIWMSGGAPAVDASGSLYVTTGNGSFDDSSPPLAPNNDFSMSFLKMNPANLTVEDFYTPSNELAWSNSDFDISSSGVVVLPDGLGPTGHPNLLIGSDKQAHLWSLDRSAMMGEFSAVANNTVQYLTLPNATTCLANPNEQCVYDTPAYYNNTVYIGMSWGQLMALPLTNGLFGASAQDIATASSLSAETYNYPGPTPMISASPAGGALVWVLDNSAYQDSGSNQNVPAGPAILRAYSAAGLGTALYSSSSLAADTAAYAIKYTVPVIANGHVYVGGGHQVTVYGLSP